MLIMSIFSLCSRRFVIGGLLVKAIISALYLIILFLRHNQQHCCKHIARREIQVLLLPDDIADNVKVIQALTINKLETNNQIAKSIILSAKLISSIDQSLILFFRTF